MELMVIGCGAIGSSIVAYARRSPLISRIYLYDRVREKANFVARANPGCEAVDDVGSGMRTSDVIVEAASQTAVHEHAPRALALGKDLIIMSVGALADDTFRSDIERLSHEKGAMVTIPSGACGGFDALASARLAGLDDVLLTTTKPPKGLRDAPFITENDIDLSGIERPTIIFSGSARDAVRAFPSNVNVAATVSIAGIGFDRTRVEVVCDPRTRRNTHLLKAHGEFGEMRCEFSNLPSPDNPRTSYIAAMSAIRCVASYRSTGLRIV